jgi:hypothetical protein
MTRVHRWVAAGTVLAVAAGGFVLAGGNTASAAEEVLLSRGRPATASSVENSSLPAANAVDGSASTRWSSQFSDPQWIRIDIGAAATISRVRLNWEAAYGRAYRIEVSDDAASWRQIYSTTSSDGGVDNVTGLSGTGRYVRVYGTQRATQWGYSLWDLEIFGTGGGGGTGPKFRVAPYVATFIGNDLAGIARASGHKFFSLGFVNGTGNCQPIWSTDDATLRRNVASLREMGGDVIVSSGGWNADDLVSHCANGAAVAAAYQRVLDAYASDYLDLDPEHGDQHNNLERSIVDRRNDALRIMQDNAKANGRTLRVSYTLGVSPDAGFNAENLYVLQSALARGVEIDVVNPMTMDFYDGTSGDRMGERSIEALRKVHGQLKVLYPGRTDAQLWGMLAATPMIGQNDDQREVFTLDDARKLVAFANQQHMARLTFWATSRDNGGCPGKKVADATCSGISQQQYEFTRIFQGFTG